MSDLFQNSCQNNVIINVRIDTCQHLCGNVCMVGITRSKFGHEVDHVELS